MRKLFLLIPATLILNMTIAQDTKSGMTQKSGSLDGKSFKITMTAMGNQSMNTQPVDKTITNPGNKSSEMEMREKSSTDKKMLDQNESGTDNNSSSKTSILKFRNGMIKSSFAGAGKWKDCSYTTASSFASTDAISFTSSCITNDNMDSGKSNNIGDKSNASGTDMNSSGTNNNSSDRNMNSSNQSRAEWTGTVTGNNITGNLKVTENGQNRNYSFTGTMTDMSGQLGMEE